jgi:hypothetical protein
LYAKFHEYLHALQRQLGFVNHSSPHGHPAIRREQCGAVRHTTVGYTDKQHRTVRYTTRWTDERYSTLGHSAGRTDEWHSAIRCCTLGNNAIRYSTVRHSPGKTVTTTKNKSMADGREKSNFFLSGP